MGSRSTYRSSVPLSAAHGVTRPVVGQMFHVKHWLLCRWCSGRCRALLWGRSAVCAGGQRPAREPSAPRAVRAASRPRRELLFVARWCYGRRRPRPPARSPHASLRLGVVDLEARPCPPVPPAPSTPAALGVLACGLVCRLEARPGPAAAHRHRGRSLRRPPHRRRLACWRVDWCVVSKPGQAPPPPTGTAARPCPHSNFACNSPECISRIEV